ncbi:hypothetical protein OSG_eHP3_00015 [environmental Halophage eHP-3]|nr:hypothetical protein OSG_eHP3_00015 [environmental Halophage eHP-3]
MGDTPNRTLTESLRGTYDLANDTFRVALISAGTSYTFDPDTHEFVSDILDNGTTAEELSGTAGYTGSSDRKTLQNTTITQDNTDDEGVWNADNVKWSGVESTEDIQGWVVYRQVGGDDTTPGDDDVILVVDDSQSDAPADLPLPTNGSDIEIAIDPEGLINQQVK